ncbi:MAG: hypothetical protein EZS28_048637 [Streblomastix strix]|uniref:Uncharacterized protein n=1 Tax=Streblomastix strix TaxID=222440 RepID=A0A5J4TBP3_9EUKA|nr:MAG: hypothetical protein EZS28_048637 [Streblomastix strix]
MFTSCGRLDLNSIQDRKTRQDRKIRDTKSCRTVGQMDRLRFHPQFDSKHIGMNIIAQNQHNRRQNISCLVLSFLSQQGFHINPPWPMNITDITKTEQDRICHNKHFTLILHNS